MERALHLIVCRSPDALSLGLKCLQAIGAQSPVVQQRYDQVARIALSDPAVEWTQEERTLILQHSLRALKCQGERSKEMTEGKQTGIIYGDSGGFPGGSICVACAEEWEESHEGEFDRDTGLSTRGIFEGEPFTCALCGEEYA